MYTASELYGGPTPVQPTANAMATDGPNPMARTTGAPGRSLANPTVVLVAMIGLAVLLVHFSVGGSISFSTKVSK